MQKTAAPAEYDADFALWAESKAAQLRDYSPAHGGTDFTVPLFDEFMRWAMPELG